MDRQMRKEAVEILKKRYSCRKFKNNPIEDEVLTDILEVGLNAAAGGNIQAVSIIQIREQAGKERLHELLPRDFVKNCDTILIYVLDYYRMMRWAEVEKAPFGRQYSFRDYMIEFEDVMCVAQSIECAATLMGVGSVYMGGVNRYYDELKIILDLPKLTVPVLMVCMGYPDDPGKGNKKLSRHMMVHENSYHTLTDDEVRINIVAEKYDNKIITIPGEQLEKTTAELKTVAAEVNGDEWAEHVAGKITEQGGLNRAQHAFGRHYNPIQQHSYNQKMYEFFKNQGLHMLPGDDWFRKGEHISE